MVQVVFLHPDLGIGGAERLVVDAAVALQNEEHEVQIFTAHHSPEHCFPETKDGTLKVTCVGDWLPRSVFGKLYALCAYIRMMYVALYLVIFSGVKYDVIFCDQISACIPILKILKRSKVLFYCHFPDLLLTQRKTLLKRLYRAPIDLLEEWTTRQADSILVNSKFTASVFQKTFSSIKAKPSVLYPSLNFSAFDDASEESVDKVLSEVGVEEPLEDEVLFLSINRYERKKNLGLAIKAFADLTKEVSSKRLRLVMAGGYDHRVLENVEHFEELEKLMKDLKVEKSCTLLKSPSDLVKVGLLKSATALLYTPEGEHFGIVPIEAMYCGTPVIAVNSGGPKETVVNGETGFLCKGDVESFAASMRRMIDVTANGGRAAMAAAGKRRVADHFSYNAFTSQLDYVINSLVDERKQD